MSKTAILYVNPNPASNKLALKYNSAIIDEVQLWDVSGKLVLNKRIDADKAVLQVADIPSGIYYLSVRTNQNLVTERIVIQH